MARTDHVANTRALLIIPVTSLRHFSILAASAYDHLAPSYLFHIYCSPPSILTFGLTSTSVYHTIGILCHFIAQSQCSVDVMLIYEPVTSVSQCSMYVELKIRFSVLILACPRASASNRLNLPTVVHHPLLRWID